MCGRFTIITPKESLEEQLQLPFPEFSPNYNVAPSQKVLSIVSDSSNKWKSGFLQWGLVPSWAKDTKIGYKMINARGETLDEKPSFKRLLSRRRCLIPADSFYEWKRNDDNTKQPYRIMVNKGDVFTFAGLWDRWKTDTQEIVTCTIITTKPNHFISNIHDRMPVILDGEDRKTWLDNSIEDKHILKELFTPYDENKMSAYEVSTLVNSPRNNSAECVEGI
ncbi:SOS response-associated peptidase [Alkalihalobacillus trypoxylicola]|uniref:Abasic site processing protein n=1 Tax=Alkalihalobacillus trypoxylicola TaxID=519424 RepID=A0A162F6X2_9BACI|nr:SOS response-associated peptidase [Alkalihalobacillus trypoxylicola]KYG34930.1 hypothetical protein AZF04_00945 [Alkalihalobacillus trypoxylicola]